MPHCSAFTPCGLLKLEDAEPLAEAIYRTSVASYGGQLSTEEGSRLDAHLYAQSIEIAAARTTLLQAGAEVLPSGVLSQLAEREREYGVIPSPGDTVSDRRGVLAARKLLPIGPTQTNIEIALQAAVGDAFVEYRTTTTAAATKWPTTASDPALLFAAASTPRKLVRLTDAVMPGAQTVTYADVPVPLSPQPTPPTDVLVGDVLLVDPGNSGRSERVTVTGVGVGTFTATFVNAHDLGALATSGSYPQWQSTKRHALVVLTAAGAAAPETRRKVHDVMARAARGVSTWAITSGGPFILNQSLMNLHLFAAIP